MLPHIPLAPGARAVIRDEEWLIRRVDPSTDGGWLLTCDGISDLVRSQSALFLTALEDTIEVLDPAATQLVADRVTVAKAMPSIEQSSNVDWRSGYTDKDVC